MTTVAVNPPIFGRLTNLYIYVESNLFPRALRMRSSHLTWRALGTRLCRITTVCIKIKINSDFCYFLLWPTKNFAWGGGGGGGDLGHRGGAIYSEGTIWEWVGDSTEVRKYAYNAKERTMYKYKGSINPIRANLYIISTLATRNTVYYMYIIAVCMITGFCKMTFLFILYSILQRYPVFCRQRSVIT